MTGTDVPRETEERERKRMKIGIYYGSTTGNTKNAANALADALTSVGDVVLHEVGSDGIAGMAECDLILLGTSTWGIGEMQDDWIAHQDLRGVDLSGKSVAVFGTGDQNGFGDSFVDAIGILAASAEKAGARLIGAWPTDGYEHSASAAIRDGRFVGLALDEDNQPAQTPARIAQWVAQLKTELGL